MEALTWLYREALDEENIAIPSGVDKEVAGVSVEVLRGGV